MQTCKIIGQHFSLDSTYLWDFSIAQILQWKWPGSSCDRHSSTTDSNEGHGTAAAGAARALARHAVNASLQTINRYATLNPGAFSKLMQGHRILKCFLCLVITLL